MRVNELKKLLSHGAIYAVGALLSRVVSFAMMPLYTRALAPAEYGVVDLLDTTAAVIVNLAGVAITYSVMRFYYDVEAPRARARVISTALGGLVALGALAVLAMWPFAPLLSRVLFRTDEFALAVRLMTVTAVVYGLVEVPMTYLRVLEKPGWYMAVSLGRLALGVALNVALVVWLRMGVMGVVWANVLGSAIVALGLVVFTVARTGVGVSMGVLRGMLAFGAPFIPGSLAMLVMHNGDRYILDTYRSLHEVGIYSLAYKLGMILTYAISVPFNNVWTTRMYTVVKEPDGIATYSRVAQYYLYALLVGWVGLAVAAPELVTIAASPEYGAAAALMPIIALGYVLREAAEFWKNAFLIGRRTRALAWIQPVAAAVNLAITWVLVKRAGVLGAAWATVLSFVALVVLTVVPAERLMRTQVSVRRLAVALAAAGGVFALARMVPPLPLPLALPIKVALALVFPVALFALGAVPADDRAAAKRMLASLRARWGRGGGAAAWGQSPQTPGGRANAERHATAAVVEPAVPSRTSLHG